MTSSASRFSRYAEAPGNFSIHSVALKDNQVSRAIVSASAHPAEDVSANARSMTYYELCILSLLCGFKKGSCTFAKVRCLYRLTGQR